MAHAALRFALLSFALLGTIAGCSESHGQETQPDSAVPHVDGGFMWGDEWGQLDSYVEHVDAPQTWDAGTVPSSCAPQDAHERVCPEAVCDGLDSYAWDGERCVRIDCGTCDGADCNHLVFSQAQCEADHASCVPEMCRATGGEWLFWAEECHHYQCGHPLPSECLIGMPVCNCGDHRSFDPARGGCFDDTTCPEVDPLPPMQLCTATGGTWTASICCNTHCGESCPLACANDACVCGPLQVFDGVRGCVDAAECHVHTTGQDCSDQVRCQDGLICCEHCGGAGCDPTMTCTAPVCDADPDIDTCGNNLLAP